MAQSPRTEVALGTVNGTNKDFNTSGSYIPGTLNVYVDGQLKRKDYDDGFDELGGTALRMRTAPKVNSVVQVRYTTAV